MHQDMTNVGMVLRKARESKGLTQSALAEKTQTALRTIISLENNKRYPSYEVLYKIINVLDISADSIFRADKSESTPEQEQIIREFSSCSHWEQSVIVKTMRTLVRSLREGNRL